MAELNFPDAPVDEDIWLSPTGTEWQWSDLPSPGRWSVYSTGGAPEVGASGDGYSWLRTVDLTSLPAGPDSWLEQDLLADTDYEFDFINARPVAEATLSLQFSDEASGVNWSAGATDYGYQLVGAGEGDTSPPGTTTRNQVRWEGTPGRGLIGDLQSVDYAQQKAPGRHRFHIQTHDIVDAQTQAIGTFNSYASGTGPYMQAMFNTRLLAFRTDLRVRFAFIDGVDAAQTWADGICRIYARARS